MIDRDTIQRITDATNILEVVSEFVTLRKAGVNYKGLCPFHNEKTPSFVVSPAKGVCKCFSCGKGGSAIHFLMELEQMSYPEALKWLAQKYHIEVKEKELSAEEQQRYNKRESLFVINNWARTYFSQNLLQHPEGRAIGMTYFRSRGFRDDIIQKFHLGYALPQRDALAHAALAQGFKQDLLVETGLCILTEQGHLRDRYAGRVIFPVHTLSGKVVAFGGRILQKNEKIAKYVNSPESEIYHKSHELYGIYLAKQAIVKHNRCYLVEGYTDVMAMHQCGIENVVASSGTALTQGQVNMIHRFTEHITVLYDGDAAGIKASLRGINMLLAEGMHVKVLLLPQGEDPDSFAHSHSAEEFAAYIAQNEVDFIRFKAHILLQDAGDDPVQRATLVADIVNSIAVIPDAIMRNVYVQECVNLLQVSEQLLVQALAKARKERNAIQPSSINRTPDNSLLHTLYNKEQSNDAIQGLVQKQLGHEQQRHYKEERNIIEQVIRHGEVVIGTDLNEETQEEVQLSLMEYVQDTLQVDGITLTTPHYMALLKDGIQHIHTPHFKAADYFLNHPNPDYSTIAADLLTEQYVLSQQNRIAHETKLTPDVLGDLIEHLMLDYKHALVSAQLRTVLQQMQTPATTLDEETLNELIHQYKELKEIQMQLAKMLGSRVINRN